MKLILILVLLTAAHTHAGLFDNGEKQRQQYEQQLTQERQTTGGWQIVAGVLVIGGVLAFTVGTAIGSKTRKNGKR